MNSLKNCENGHFYGILRQKMTLIDDSFTWFVAWACLKAKPSLKTMKIALFMAFYGKKWHWMMTASFEFWHKYVSESNYYCSTVLPPISAVCEHKNPEKLSKRPFLRHFTSFYGSVWTILFQMCSITFFDFYTIYVIGLGQKICTLTKFPK